MNNVTMLKPRLFAGVVTVLLILSACTPQEPQPIFSFAFLTDIHVQPERMAAEGFQHTIEQVNARDPAFVITGGDLIMDALGTSFGRADSLYVLYNELSAAFSMPVYNTLGNHEVFGLYTDSGIEPEHPEYGKEMYLDRMGLDQTYYSFDHQGWHFVILDAVGFRDDRRYMGYVDSLQLDWLRSDLEKVGTEIPIIISTHIPFVSVVPQLVYGGEASAGYGYLVTNTHEIMQVVMDYNVKLVLQGHLHHLEEVSFGGIHFVTAGAVSARWWLGPREGMEEGFMMVDVYADSLHWEYIDSGWEAVVPETE